MHTLPRDRLQVLVLDPAEDRDRLGSRYCAGGYLHQVIDAKHGPLFAGPQWPVEMPDVFHGQGAPEAFNGYPGAEAVSVGAEAWVIGVGLVRRSGGEPFQPRTSREVTRFAAWDVQATRLSVTMGAQQSFGDWACRLRKTIAVSGRTVRSETALACTGAAPLPVRWFAHPFFPLPAGRRLFRANIAFTVPESSGFERNSEGWICRRSGHDWQAGCFVQLGYDAAAARGLELDQMHPLVGRVTVRTDFAPASFPIWGNDRTFSFEPYWERTLAPGESAEWAIEYAFPA